MVSFRERQKRFFFIQKQFWKTNEFRTAVFLRKGCHKLQIRPNRSYSRPKLVSVEMKDTIFLSIH